MSIFSILTFCILLTIVSSDNKWPKKSQKGSDFAEAAKIPVFKDVKQFYDENGRLKEYIQQMQSKECNRTGMTTDHPNTMITWCPTPYLNDPWNWKCVLSTDLCNGKIDCPNGEDEERNMCFHLRRQNESMQEKNEQLDKLDEELSNLENK